MSSSAQSSPSRVPSFHGKSSSLVSSAKSLLNEQHNRLSAKHNFDLDLIDDLRAFLKTKSNIEKEYSQSLIKLVNSQISKKYPQISDENDSEIKTLYTAWKTYLEEVENFSKNRLSQFEQFGAICDTLKQMRSHKVQVSKKAIDQHLKKMQEEMLTSITEIDKTRKLYFDEEHLAKQARDKEEKVKKRKVGIFSSLANLQNKKEKSSAYREASDIQSNQARNDYIMALSAGNAHFDHYYSIDLPNLMHSIDDEVLDKCRAFILTLLQSEMNSLSLTTQSIDKATKLVESTSSDYTNSFFLSDSQSACLRDAVFYDFDACDNDTVRTVSLDHNADIALRNEVQKWFTWFSKECRNLNRLSQQLIKCQSLLAEGHKTVEVSGSGPVDIEVRIDEIKQQIRKCEISKLKAKARMQAIRDGGLEIEDYDSFESQITTEIKQASLDVDINIGMPLSRTPSLRSTNIGGSLSGDGRISSLDGGRISSLDGGRVSSLDGKMSDDQPDTDNYQTPEPEVSVRSIRPESSSSDRPESPEVRDTREAPAYKTSYDPNVSWGDYEDQPIDQPVEATADEYQNNSYEVNEANYDSYEQNATPIDGTQIIGKICRTLYPYESQTVDDLSFLENENLTIIGAIDKDWVKAQNDRYMIGFVPASYLEVIGDAPQDDLVFNNDVAVDQEITANDTVNNNENQIFVRAIYDFVATNNEEISFNEGDLLTVISKSDDGWWYGITSDGNKGHFPSMLVEDHGENGSSAAFEESESGEESEVSNESVGKTVAPPPSFAPPKPAYLTPHQVVIIQPTPEIESKPQLGEEDEEANEIKIEVNNSEPEKDVEPESNTTAADFDPDFTLDKPSLKKITEEVEPEVELVENVNELDEKKLETIQCSIIVNVEEIECTAEEISEAITHEAICDAAKEALTHHENHCDAYQNNNCKYENEESDYEDLK